MQNRPVFISVLLALIVIVAGAATASAADLAAEEKRIRELDAAWVAAVAAKDVKATAAFYADDGRIMPQNVPAAEGPEAVGAVWSAFFQLKDFALTFEPTSIAVAEAGDIAYDIGTYSLAFTGDQGPVQDLGKYVVVWKKVDGEWKVAADIFNSNGPPQ
jgi:uncharacterized protein (TIGR02246 family)